MFFHAMEPGPSGARAGQNRGDGARTVSTSFAPHTHSLFLQRASLHIGAGTRKLAGARKQVWCRLFPSWSSEGATETLGVAIWLLTPLLVPHECTGAAPQPAAIQPLSSALARL